MGKGSGAHRPLQRCGGAGRGRLPVLDAVRYPAYPHEGWTMAQAHGDGWKVHAYERIADWRRARERAGRMLLALDFDGTLAPIVPVPDRAALLPAAHDAIGGLLRRRDTLVAVVSGRALGDVRQ